MQDVIIRKEGKRLIAELKCELDHHKAKGIREAIDEALVLHTPKELVLDFSGVGFMDSSGIGLILGRVERCETISARLRLSGLGAVQMRLLRMSGIMKLRCVTVDGE